MMKIQKTPTVISQILRAAHARGINQKDLAARAGISEETVSRAKKRGSARWAVIEALARAANVNVGLVSAAQIRRAPVLPPDASFRQRYRWLVWANPSAPDEVLLRRALVNPEFRTLLDAALEFGVDRITREWDLLKAEGDEETVRAQPMTDRLLRNIHDGYQQAAA